MQVLEKVKTLLKNSAEIKSLFLKKIPLWKSDPRTYDKTRWGFYQGDNDGWYSGQTVTLHFGAWAGTYGDSSTYKEINVDGDIFREHFMKYLNDNRQEIMMAIADSIDNEAKSMKDKAEKELNADLDKLKKLTVS